MNEQPIITTNNVEPLSSNAIEMNFSIYEVSMNFLRDTAANGSITRESMADIRISPQLAKMITFLMQENIGKYEKEFGVIPMPKQP
jgi:hypothetical protein